MKQKDLVLISFIVGMSAIFSYFISNAIVASPKSRQQKVEVVEAIQSDFQTPDEKYFNESAIDPTQTIQIGNDSNTKPFGGQ